MPKISLRVLFVVTALIAVAIGIVQHIYVKAMYSGLSSDVGGGGYSKRYYTKAPRGISDLAIEIEILESMTVQQPEWNQRYENPPLSARRALAIADDFRINRLKDWDQFDWSLTGLRLTPLDLKNNKWCWVVQFELAVKPNVNLTASHLPELEVWVMMDGTIVEPSDPDGLLKPIEVREPSVARELPKSRF